MKMLSTSFPDLTEAAAILESGRLVGIPTETVYGLAADARNPAALKAVFRAKGRPESHPLIVHIGRIDEIEDWARDVAPLAWDLAKAFWPGPLTLVLKKKDHVHDLVTGGQDTVAIRMPDHPATLQLLRLLGHGVCAPSANRFGRISPTQASDVVEELGSHVSAVINGGRCSIGIESTILDLSTGAPCILRQGQVSATHLEGLSGARVGIRKATNGGIRVPGTHHTHYAPSRPTHLVSRDYLEKLGRKSDRPQSFIAIAFDNHGSLPVLKMPMAADAYARLLYATMRSADQSEYEAILIEEVPESDAWGPIRDRIRRAASSDRELPPG